MNRKSSLIFPILVILLVIGCIAVLFAANFLLSMPTQAKILFGSPVPTSDLVTDIYNATYLVINKDTLLSPYGVEGNEILFEILPGETALEVAVKLEQAGAIQHAGAFIKYLQYRGFDRVLIANRYLLPTGLSAIEVAEKLRNPNPEFIRITIFPGQRYDELLKILTDLFPSVDDHSFSAALDEIVNPSDLYDNNTTMYERGYFAFLLPGQYTLHWDSSATDIVEIVFGNLEQQISDDILAGFEQQGINVFEGMVLASIIEREALHTDEMALISSVFHNRLEIGMNLEADPTVQFSLGYQEDTDSWWKNGLTLTDLQFDFYYNTYVYPGLPPAPICNPSLEAISAAANPETTDYLFFRTTCDGSGYHNFAYTYEEHLGNECP